MGDQRRLFTTLIRSWELSLRPSNKSAETICSHLRSTNLFVDYLIDPPAPLKDSGIHPVAPVDDVVDITKAHILQDLHRPRKRLLFTSLMRTLVPLVAGLLLGRAAKVGLDLDDATVTASVTAGLNRHLLRAVARPRGRGRPDRLGAAAHTGRAAPRLGTAPAAR